jgi:hypothetical protein
VLLPKSLLHIRLLRRLPRSCPGLSVMISSVPSSTASVCISQKILLSEAQDFLAGDER